MRSTNSFRHSVSETECGRSGSQPVNVDEEVNLQRRASATSSRKKLSRRLESLLTIVLCLIGFAGFWMVFIAVFSWVWGTVILFGWSVFVFSFVPIVSSLGSRSRTTSPALKRRAE